MKRFIAIAMMASALAARAEFRTHLLSVQNVPTNSTGTTVTNQLPVTGQVVGSIIYCPTNCIVTVATVAGRGASFLSRGLISSQGVTNQIETTNSLVVVGDYFSINAKSSGDTNASKSVSVLLFYKDQ